ncbi:hypothetical protein F4781DRAFT_6223 [Annulohypoxylon bovei var. microspora]|nr:hypothetical protein F4781DRAFT_6223 [Annulohypoxylon bovei var. microspora]
MPRVARILPNTPKRSKIQRRHQSRCDGKRTLRDHPIARKTGMRHNRTRLNDGVEPAPSKVFGEESPKPVLNHNYLESMGLDRDAPKEIFDNDNGVQVQDPNIMDCNYIDASGSNLEMPLIQLYQCQQCGMTISDMIYKNLLFELGRTYSSGNQQDNRLYSTSVGSTTNVDLGDLDYQHVRESTLGCSSEGSSPETILDSGSTVRCGFCEHQTYVFYDSRGFMDHLLYFTPGSNFGLRSPFLQTQFTKNATVNADQFLSDVDVASKIPFYSSETHSEAWLKQYDQKYTNELQLDTPDDQTRMNRWVVNQSCDDSMINPREDHLTATGVETQTTPSTHSSEEWQLEKDWGSENQQLEANIQANYDQVTPNKKWWACPWYKKDSWRYHECSKYRLRRLRDVKQHTYRKHRKPDIYCPVCFKLFANAKERDGHVQKLSCASRTKPEFDGISEEQRKELNQIAIRGRNDVQQWFYMWDIIFPHMSRPLSPYLGNGWEKLLPPLRNFWNRRQSKIISKALEMPLFKSEPQIIQCVVDEIFDLFEKESSYWGYNSDVSPENVSPETPREDLSKFGASPSAVSSDFTQHQWDPASALQELSPEQQVVFQPDSNIEQLVGINVDVSLDIGSQDQDLIPNITNQP